MSLKIFSRRLGAFSSLLMRRHLPLITPGATHQDSDQKALEEVFYLVKHVYDKLLLILLINQRRLMNFDVFPPQFLFKVQIQVTPIKMLRDYFLSIIVIKRIWR